jgi:hypothetical protein
MNGQQFLNGFLSMITKLSTIMSTLKPRSIFTASYVTGEKASEVTVVPVFLTARRAIKASGG